MFESKIMQPRYTINIQCVHKMRLLSCVQLTETFAVIRKLLQTFFQRVFANSLWKHALTFAMSRGRCWKPRPNVNALKRQVRSYYCIKIEIICYISHYLLHYFVSPFHWCLAHAIVSDCTRSRAGHYIFRDGSYSVAPVLAYWKLRNRALTARELPC